MPDVFDREKRSWIMSRVSGKDTKPEMVVRRMIHAMGYRYRLHARDLPGRPDIVLPKHKKVVFVHGCFWHGHPGCKRSDRPTSNAEFWNTKIDRNIVRDATAVAGLEAQGWKVLTVWQCRIRNREGLHDDLNRFLGGEKRNA